MITGVGGGSCVYLDSLSECPSVTYIVYVLWVREHHWGHQGMFLFSPLVSPLVWRGTQEFMCVTGRDTQGTEAKGVGTV